MVLLIWMISPLFRQSFLLSSSTVFMFSIHSASTGPSSTIHLLEPRMASEHGLPRAMQAIPFVHKSHQLLNVNARLSGSEISGICRACAAREMIGKVSHPPLFFASLLCVSICSGEYQASALLRPALSPQRTYDLGAVQLGACLRTHLRFGAVLEATCLKVRASTPSVHSWLMASNCAEVCQRN